MSDISFEHVLSSQYTVFDGLAGMHVEDIYQDRRGRRRRQPASTAPGLIHLAPNTVMAIAEAVCSAPAAAGADDRRLFWWSADFAAAGDFPNRL